MDIVKSTLNKATLFIYVFLLWFQVRRYYSDIDGVVYWGAYNVVLIVLCVVAGLKILVNLKDNFKYSVVSAALILFAAVCIVFKNDKQWYMIFDWHTNMLNLSLLIVSMYGICFSDIACIFVIVRSFNSITRILAAVMGLLPGTTGEAMFLGKGYYVQTYGFGSKNALFALWFWIALVWIYLVKNNEKKTMHIILIGILSIVFSCLSLSRTGIIVMAAVFIMFLITALDERGALNIKIKPVLYLADKVMLVVPALCTLFSVVGLLLYNYCVSIGKFKNVSNLLQRFKQFSMDCAFHGIKLPWAGEKYTQITDGPFNCIWGDSSLSTYCDNSIHNLLINYGLIWLILLVVAIQIWAVRSYKRKDRVSLIIISAICIYSMFESYATLWSHDVFLLMMLAKSTRDEVAHLELPDTGEVSERKITIQKAMIIFLLAEVVVALISVRSTYMQWWLLFFDILAAAAYLFFGRIFQVHKCD